jgi:hypothetical protein
VTHVALSASDAPWEIDDDSSGAQQRQVHTSLSPAPASSLSVHSLDTGRHARARHSASAGQRSETRRHVRDEHGDDDDDYDDMNAICFHFEKWPDK